MSGYIIAQHALTCEGEIFLTFCSTKEIAEHLANAALGCLFPKGSVRDRNDNPCDLIPFDSDLGKQIFAVFPNPNIFTTLVDDDIEDFDDDLIEDLENYTISIENPQEYPELVFQIVQFLGSEQYL